MSDCLHCGQIPDIVARLSGLYTTLNQRLGLHESLVSLSGRLDTVLSQAECRAALAPASLKVDKTAKENRSVAVERYIEGKSDSEEAEDTDLDAEVEVERFEDEGSVEDIELGRESESEEEEESEDMDEFIDDEAEEGEAEDTDEDDDESE